MTAATDPPLTDDELARLLEVSGATLAAWLRLGKRPASFRIGGCVVYRRSIDSGRNGWDVVERYGVSVACEQRPPIADLPADFAAGGAYDIRLERFAFLDTDLSEDGLLPLEIYPVAVRLGDEAPTPDQPETVAAALLAAARAARR